MVTSGPTKKKGDDVVFITMKSGSTYEGQVNELNERQGKILYIESNKYLKRNMIWHHSRMRNNKMNNFNIANINTRATQLNPNHLEK